MVYRKSVRAEDQEAGPVGAHIWILAEHRYRRMVHRYGYIAILTPISALISMIPDIGVYPIIPISGIPEIGYAPISGIHDNDDIWYAPIST